VSYFFAGHLGILGADNLSTIVLLQTGVAPNKAVRSGLPTLVFRTQLSLPYTFAI